MSYTALYRKFRPSEFSDVKGQDHIVTTLKNQINADRIGHVRPLWQKYLQKRSTVNTRWMGILVANVRPVGQLPQEHR